MTDNVAIAAHLLAVSVVVGPTAGPVESKVAVRLHRRFMRAAVASLAAGLALAACGPAAPVGPVPDFALPDVNAASPSFQKDVSPRDFLGKVSAWYFGHSS
jgi:hypothetical protein